MNGTQRIERVPGLGPGNGPSRPALRDVRARQDPGQVARALDALRAAARGADNTMYPLLECVRAYATVGQMCDALREVWGEWEEVPSI